MAGPKASQAGPRRPAGPVDGLPPAVSQTEANDKQKTQTTRPPTTAKQHNQQTTTYNDEARTKTRRDGGKTAPRPLKTRHDKHKDKDKDNTKRKH